MFGNKVVVGSVEISQTPWRGSESTALSSCREVSRPRQVEAGTSGSAGFVYRKHLCGEGFQVLLLPRAVAGICGVGPHGQWWLQGRRMRGVVATRHTHGAV